MIIELNGRVLPGPEPATRLVDWIRDTAHDKSVKESCGEGYCGACTVLVGGRPALACCTLAIAVVGRPVWTARGLAGTPLGRLVQAKIAARHGVQCGFCGPGMLVAGVAWLSGRTPGEPAGCEVAAAICGNVCRCSGYRPIIDALEDAARMPEAAA